MKIRDGGLVIAENEDIKDGVLVIPDGVTSIGSFAFVGCSDLKNLIIPNSVESYSLGAFDPCRNVTKVSTPAWLINPIKTHTNLKEVTITSGDITSELFYGWKNLKKVSISEGVNSIGPYAFRLCQELKEITIPNSVVSIRDQAFADCLSLESVTLGKGIKLIDYYTFKGCFNLKTIKVPYSIEIGLQFTPKKIKFTPAGMEFSKDETLSGEYVYDATEEMIDNAYGSRNYGKNFYQLNKWKKEGETRFIPPEYVIKTFPHEQMAMFYHQNNNQRWGKLIKALGLDTLEDQSEKNNSLTDLMKIYYAIGGFSDNQGESELAFDYILKYVSAKQNENTTPSQIGANIHSRFGGLILGGEPFNKDFAYFFMKYYKDNPDFMVFRIKDENGELLYPQDYLCAAHNAFSGIQKAYPNRVINGNTENQLLSPRFVAEHCSIVKYEDIEPGNDQLAYLLGRKSYSQETFDKAQNALAKAREIKQTGKYALKPVKVKERKLIARVLDKDDEYGFVIGDETNCCQKFNDAAESCVIDGFTSENAGFTVIEQDLGDGERRLLAQAFTWYDPKTKTLCYDNFEIPKNVLAEMRKDGAEITKDGLLKVIESIAVKTVTQMQANGYEVKQVTTGVGYNDIGKEFENHYGHAKDTNARNPNGRVYTDAEKQYVIMDYDRITGELGERIQAEVAEAEKIMKEFKSSSEDKKE